MKQSATDRYVMTIEDVYDRLSIIYQDFFDDDTIVATPELTASKVKGWDSLAQVRLLLTIERKLGVSFTAAETSTLASVGDLARLIERKL